MKIWRIAGLIGRMLLTVGVLLLLFVVYQLWGTGLHEAKAQKSLRKEFQQVLAKAPTHEPPSTTRNQTGSTSTVAQTVVATRDIAPDIGDVVGEIEIPRIHVDKMIVQGVSLEQLDRAPGHYPQTPFPGQAGNVGIAGHRTTFGAPFEFINRLEPGDKIEITTVQGHFTYVVQWSKIVLPSDVWVLDRAQDHPNTLTLSACHPLEDLSHRYIVRAVLQGRPVPKFHNQDEVTRAYVARHGDDKIAGGVEAAAHPGAWLPMVGWGLLCALIWVVVAWGSRRWRRRDQPSPPRWVRSVLPYVVGVPMFLGVLFLCFENLSQILPAGL